MFESKEARQWLPAITIAIRCFILFVAVLPIPLTAAEQLQLSVSQTATWLLAVYGIPGLLGLALTIFYRQPLLTTGNLFALILIASISHQFSFAELNGAFIATGASLLVISALGLTSRLSDWLPAPVVFGLLAGAVLPFVWRIFSAMGEAPLLVGLTFLTYLLSRRFLGERLPAILPALLSGLTLALLTAGFGSLPDQGMFPRPEIVAPVFSLPAIAGVTPVVVVLIVLQSNLPSLVFIKDQGFEPAENVIDTVSGIGTFLGSFIGPTGVSLSLPVTSLVAGPEAGERSLRYRSAVIAAAGFALIGLLGGVAAQVPVIIPAALMTTLAGLALINVLASSLQRITRGPLLLGPMFAFAIALSDISLFGFGAFFWALVAGSAISHLLEGEKVEALRKEEGA